MAGRPCVVRFLIGIPWGVQCFKFAKLAFFPFGKEVELGGGGGSLLLNILWLLISGIALALEAAMLGVFFCCHHRGHFPLACSALSWPSSASCPLARRCAVKGLFMVCTPFLSLRSNRVCCILFQA